MITQQKKKVKKLHSLRANNLMSKYEIVKKNKGKKYETNKLTCFLIFKNLFLILINQNNPKILKIINLNQKNNF